MEDMEDDGVFGGIGFDIDVAFSGDASTRWTGEPEETGSWRVTMESKFPDRPPENHSEGHRPMPGYVRASVNAGAPHPRG